MITITDRAADKVREFMAAEDDDASALRIAIEGGGCALKPAIPFLATKHRRQYFIPHNA